MKTASRTARRSAAALVVAALTLTTGASVAQAADSARGDVLAAPGLTAALHHKAPAGAKAINGHSRHWRAAHRPGRARTRSQPRDFVFTASQQVSYFEFRGCYGPFSQTWGFSRTCVWDGEDVFGQLVTRQFHYQWWNGFTYRPWYTVGCDEVVCRQI